MAEAGSFGLDPLQRRVLRLLAGFDPAWTLTGGGALAGLYLGHRRTRDLDLFWHQRSTLPDVERLIEVLRGDGLGVDVLRRTPGFVELRVASDGEVTVVDLVADAVPVIEPPARIEIDGVAILVDTRHEILVNKLNALLSRSELRDLVDVRALLAAGGDLHRGLVDAERKDGGFSAATLAWVIRGMPLGALAKASGLKAEAMEELTRYRDELATTLARMSRP